jgi:hypothetical protein
MQNKLIKQKKSKFNFNTVNIIIRTLGIHSLACHDSVIGHQTTLILIFLLNVSHDDNGNNYC